VKTDTLKVPGATLYYEVRGSGPVLLLICGGVYDAAGYAGLAGQLADRYTVVTYDRRGNSRSPLDGPPEEQIVAEHADDAYRVLEAAAGGEPAYVFGNSSGAQIGLELAIHHPGRVRVLVAHEPPCLELLPEREHWRAVLQDVAKAYATGGADAAGQVFGAAMRMRGGEPEDERVPGGADAPQGEPDPELLAAMERMGRNVDFFFGYEVPPFGRYVPDTDALRASGVRVVMAAGEESAGEPPHRVAFAVAERLGAQTVLFPGDHGGFGQRVEAFAARLREVIER
jgi:pimeloyl-ACP methyl ester carboxylesterase